mmetsp:Transcript_5501/g.15795  ORF Transcript_5501/g.15795 Transcript_5501/m.15795 type:complete len:101 (+) Transcript_5501:1426-1728(+)
MATSDLHVQTPVLEAKVVLSTRVSRRAWLETGNAQRALPPLTPCLQAKTASVRVLPAPQRDLASKQPEGKEGRLISAELPCTYADPLRTVLAKPALAAAV